MEFGEFLRAKMLEKGMTIRQLALYAKCSDSYLSLIERGERGNPRPTQSILRKLSKPLGIPVEVLLAEAGYETDENDSVDKSVLQVLRESIGMTKSQMAERLELSLAEVERLEKEDVGVETLEIVCGKLFSRSSRQRELLSELEKFLLCESEELVLTFESFLKTYRRRTREGDL